MLFRTALPARGRCYVGLKRLDKGLAAMPEVSAEKEWHAYLLDWNAPPYGEKLPWRLHGSTCLCA